jgi:hypothetical protein
MDRLPRVRLAEEVGAEAGRAVEPPVRIVAEDSLVPNRLASRCDEIERGSAIINTLHFRKQMVPSHHQMFAVP